MKILASNMLIFHVFILQRGLCRPYYSKLQYQSLITLYAKRCIEMQVTSSTFRIFLSVPVGKTVDLTPARSVFFYLHFAWIKDTNAFSTKML